MKMLYSGARVINSNPTSRCIKSPRTLVSDFLFPSSTQIENGGKMCYNKYYIFNRLYRYIMHYTNVGTRP